MGHPMKQMLTSPLPPVPAPRASLCRGRPVATHLLDDLLASSLILGEDWDQMPLAVRGVPGLPRHGPAAGAAGGP